MQNVNFLSEGVRPQHVLSLGDTFKAVMAETLDWFGRHL